MVKNEQQLALDVLLDVYRNSSYSNLSLNKLLPKGRGKQAKTNAFVTALVYGVIERDLTLEYLMNQYSKKSCQKLDLEVALILKMGFYELLYLNSIPDNAVVNECVNLCYAVKKVSAKGFVNGVLRGFIRDGKRLTIREPDDLKSLSIAYSCPLWLVQKWTAEYSYEQTKKLLQCSMGRPPLTARVNTLLTTDEALTAALKQRGIHVTPSRCLEHALELTHTGNLEQIPEFQAGHFYIQDLSSQFCAKLADAQPGERVFDLCAAPGSKSFTMAQTMDNQGELLAFDLYDHKLELIQKTADKLGIRNLIVKKGDAGAYNEALGLADKVLCDVPCSGLGIIRRKPEIKYKPQTELDQLPPIQRRILDNAARYVKTGGRLIYSTCSLNRAENQDIAAAFLAEHLHFAPLSIPSTLQGRALIEDNMATFLPQFMNSDGFFVALFTRKN